MEATDQSQGAPSRWGDSAWSLANTLCTMVASFAGFLLASRWLGTEQIGRLALVGAALFPLRFAELGLAGAVTRYVGAYHGGRTRSFVGQIVRLSWVLSLIAAVLMLALCAALTPALLTGTLKGQDQAGLWHLAALLIATALIQLMAAPLYGSLVGLKRFRLVYVAGTLIALGQLAAVIPLILNFGIAGLAMVQLGVQAAGFLVYAPALLRLHNNAEVEEAPLNRRAFLSFTLQFSFNSMLTTLLEPVAKLIIGASTSLSLLGTFEVLWRIFVQLRTVLLAPLNPLGVEMIALWKDKGAALESRYRLMVLSALAAIGVLLAAAVPTHLAFDLIAAHKGGSNLLVALSVSLAMVFGFSTVPSYFLSLAANEVRPIIAGTLTILGIQLAGNLLLPATLDWRAVMGIFVAAYAVGAVVQMALVQRLLGFSVVPSPAALRQDARHALSLARRVIFARLGR